MLMIFYLCQIQLLGSFGTRWSIILRIFSYMNKWGGVGVGDGMGWDGMDPKNKVQRPYISSISAFLRKKKGVGVPLRLLPVYARTKPLKALCGQLILVQFQEGQIQEQHWLECEELSRVHLRLVQKQQQQQLLLWDPIDSEEAGACPALPWALLPAVPAAPPLLLPQQRPYTIMCCPTAQSNLLWQAGYRTCREMGGKREQGGGGCWGASEGVLQAQTALLGLWNMDLHFFGRQSEHIGEKFR